MSSLCLLKEVVLLAWPEQFNNASPRVRATVGLAFVFLVVIPTLSEAEGE